MLAQKLHSSSRRLYGPPLETSSLSHEIPCESICGIAEENQDPKRDRIKRDTENSRVRNKRVVINIQFSRIELLINVTY